MKWGFLAFAALALVPRAALAEEHPRFRLVYEARAEACPNAQSFLGQIRERTSRPRLAEDGEPASLVTVGLRAMGDGRVEGSVTIRDAEGNAGPGRAPPEASAQEERSVDGASCVEVAKALALVVALVLDPDAKRGEVLPPTLPPPPQRPEPPSTPVARARGHRPVFGAVLGAGIIGGIGPAAAPLGRVGLEVGLEVEPDAVEGAPGSASSPSRASSSARGPVVTWLPLARLTLEGALTSSALDAGTHRYSWWTFALQTCPLQTHVGRFVGSPCLGFQGGLHRGATEGIPTSGSRSELWLAPEGLARIAYALSPELAVELEGAAVVPLRPTRFFLAPNRTLHQVPDVLGTVSLGLSYRFR